MKNSMNLAVILSVASCVYVSDSVPIPGISRIHSLATFDTTKTYWYTKHLGLNNRFLKPSTVIPRYTKFISNPYQQQIVVLPQTFSQVTPEVSEPFIPTVSVTQSELPSPVQLNSNKESSLSLFLLPPKQDAYVTSDSFSIVSEEVKVPQANFVSESVSPTVTDFTSEPLIKEQPNKINNESSFSGFVPFKGIEKENNEVIQSEKPSISLKDFNNLDDADLLKLLKRVISQGQNKPTENNSVVVNDVPNVSTTSTEVSPIDDEKPQMESRQDSSVEQPRPFLSSVPRLMPEFAQEQPKQQFTFPQETNGRFTEQSTPQLQNIPSSQNAPNHGQFSSQFNQPKRPSLDGHNRFTLPSNIPQNPPPPMLQFPFGNPQNSQFGGGNSPPEPENGYNPFHLHDNFPEPPYESEFVNEPPLDDEPSTRSSSDHSESVSPPLDFAQSTLRNVRTEELLEVTRRKPVPPGCAYNTISYGLNGEDCIERKKRSDS